MRSTHPDLITTGDDTATKLAVIRDGLVKKQRASKGKGKGKVYEPSTFELNLPDAISLIIGCISSDGATSIAAGTRLTNATLALEVLDIVLADSVSSLEDAGSPATTQVREMFSAELLLKLATVNWAIWDSGPSTLLHKCRSANLSILAISRALDSTIVPRFLLAQLSVAPWLNKRSINVFDALMACFSVEEMGLLSVRPGTPAAEGVLRRFTEGMAAADEIATLSGKVAVHWIEKVLTEVPELPKFWLSPIVDAVRGDARARSNICLYLLPGLFQLRPTAFAELVNDGDFLKVSEDETNLSASLAVLKIGNSIGLLDLDANAPQLLPSTSNSAPKIRARAPGTTVALPAALLETCLHHRSPSLRCSVLSLLVHTPQAALPVPTSSFAYLRTFYTYSMGDEDGEFRMASMALSGRLLVRLRDLAWKSHRRDPSSPYVAEIRSFIEWFASTLLTSLNPARPFRTRINALRLLDVLFQSHLDPGFSAVSAASSVVNSSYRRTAPVPSPQFQAKHGRINETTGWPFVVPLVTPASTFTLLRLLLSTYTALRNLSIALLEKFPAPLPGYDKEDARAKDDLLVPALKMVRSGREAETSAGAGILGLIWRKWVFEGGASWNLGELGGWSQQDGAPVLEGPFSFLSSLMDLAEVQIEAHITDLGRAASTSPMHGTLLALRQLFVSIPAASLNQIGSVEERRAIFLRALRIVEKVWAATAPVLAASAPEGMGTADTEEARAMLIETTGTGNGEDGGEGSESIGPMHKIVLSATWRAMKEAGELLETILRLPSELGGAAFQEILKLEDVQHVGNLFADWLAKIRHRGAFMALHPCYARACSALLVCTDWPEVKQLPITWLDMHLDSIVSKKISTTRRSAGLPYCILGIMTSLLPADQTTFNKAFNRLFEIAESTTDTISDATRVHAMNTLRTIFLDAKAAGVVTAYVERGFLISISMFRSPNWICRNVAMLLFSSLITRAFGARRMNLPRDSTSLKLRVTSADFFGRYPSLHAVLLEELDLSAREHLADTPTSNLHSNLFTVLMLLALLQTPDRGEMTAESPSKAFVALVLACSRSRVWKIRDAAGDALTGLVSPSEVPAYCLNLLSLPNPCSENELHGRLIQVFSLLEARGEAASSDYATVHDMITSLLPTLMSEKRSFAVRTTYLDIARVCGIHHGYLCPSISDIVTTSLKSAEAWPTAASHLPSAEKFVEAAFLLAIAYEPRSTSVFRSGLVSRFLEVRRQALNHLQESGAELELLREALRRELLELALSKGEAADARIAALNILSEVRLEAIDASLTAELVDQYRSSVIVPLREALLPFIARTAALAEAKLEVVKLIKAASGVDQSVEERESASAALRSLELSKDAFDSSIARVVLLLAQDDDPTVRDIATDAFTKAWKAGPPATDRRIVELTVAAFGPQPFSAAVAELNTDAAVISSPSSLLFAIERPNIFVDDLLETDVLTPNSSTPSSEEMAKLVNMLSSALGSQRDRSPLGLLGNELVCKWAARLVDGVDRLKQGAGVDFVDRDGLVDWLRLSLV